MQKKTTSSTFSKLATEAADQYLSTLSEVQEQLLKTVKTVSTFAASGPVAYSVPTPPFAAELPTFKEVADANFEFAAKLLSQQKAFADKMFAATKA